jgi:hypothetical protein
VRRLARFVVGVTLIPVSDNVVFNALFPPGDQVEHGQQYDVLVSVMFEGALGVSYCLHEQLVGVRPLGICRSFRVTKRTTQLNIGQIGRIVVNPEKIPRDEGEQREGSTWRATLQLTSLIEMGQSVLSLDTQCGSSDGHPSSNTLRSSFSTSMTKASQFSPSSARTSSSGSTWVGHHRHSPQPSDTELSVESIPSTIDGDAADRGPPTGRRGRRFGPVLVQALI